MAIYMCEYCDTMTDDDYNPGSEWKDGLICEDCQEELICDTCEKQVTEGDLNDDGECASCAKATYKERKDAYLEDMADEVKISRHYEQQERDTARTLREGE